MGYCKPIILSFAIDPFLGPAPPVWGGPGAARVKGNRGRPPWGLGGVWRGVVAAVVVVMVVVVIVVVVVVDCCCLLLLVDCCLLLVVLCLLCIVRCVVVVVVVVAVAVCDSLFVGCFCCS